MCCMNILSTKVSPGQVITALALLLVRASPQLFHVVPGVIIPITYYSNHRLQQFKGIAITVFTCGPSGPWHWV